MRKPLYVVVVLIVPLDRVSECLSGQLQLVASQVGYYICGLCYNLLTSCLMKTISVLGLLQDVTYKSSHLYKLSHMELGHTRGK